MANRTIKIYGYNHDASSTAVVTWAGAEVFNGAVTASVIAESAPWTDDSTDPVELFSFTYNNADDSTETEHALGVSVGAGDIRVGEVYVISNNDNANYEEYPDSQKPPVTLLDGKWYWTPGNGGIYHDVMGAGEARHNNSMPERKNVLINGAVPSETGYTGSDNGTLTYNGHEWGLSAGDALSCTVRVPAILGSGGGNKYQFPLS